MTVLRFGFQVLGGIFSPLLAQLNQSQAPTVPFGPYEIGIYKYDASSSTWKTESGKVAPPDTAAKLNGLSAELLRRDQQSRDEIERFLRHRLPLTYMPPVVNPIVYQQTARGVNWRRPSDPRILDLDGDGVGLSASSSSVLFDHNADGIKTGSQWAGLDDGILIRDLNGTIDSGRELFGDNTLLANGQTAANGIQALTDLDSNHDGVFNVGDTAYAELKVWRDLKTLMQRCLTERKATLQMPRYPSPNSSTFHQPA